MNNEITAYEQIAKICHEANRAYCETLGDTSQPSWEDAPDWQKKSIIEGVKGHIENPDMTPDLSHQAWLYHKKKEGWVYGPEKDPEKKEHPNMVPYAELPEEQRRKDYLFSAICSAFRVEE